MVIRRVAAVTMVGAGLVASGLLLGQGLPGAPSSSANVEDAGNPPSALPSSGKTPTCSIWSVPTLEVGAVPRSNLTEGVPYVAVCTDDAGEETAFVFVYGNDAMP